jgi:hypothetical protein
MDLQKKVFGNGITMRAELEETLLVAKSERMRLPGLVSSMVVRDVIRGVDECGGVGFEFMGGVKFTDTVEDSRSKAEAWYFK